MAEVQSTILRKPQNSEVLALVQHEYELAKKELFDTNAALAAPEIRGLYPVLYIFSILDELLSKGYVDSLLISRRLANDSRGSFQASSFEEAFTQAEKLVHSNAGLRQ